jgi:hypothetical protein
MDVSLLINFYEIVNRTEPPLKRSMTRFEIPSTIGYPKEMLLTFRLGAIPPQPFPKSRPHGPKIIHLGD